RPPGRIRLPLRQPLRQRLARRAGGRPAVRCPSRRRDQSLEGGGPADRAVTLRFFGSRGFAGAAVIATRLPAVVWRLGVAPPGDRVVNFFNWSDYIEPSVLTGFTATTGIRVQYDTFDSNDILETKLLAGKSGYDVVVPTAYFLQRQIKAGVFQKLD